MGGTVGVNLHDFFDDEPELKVFDGQGRDFIALNMANTSMFTRSITGEYNELTIPLEEQLRAVVEWATKVENMALDELAKLAVKPMAVEFPPAEEPGMG